MSGTMPSLPNTPPWRGARLKNTGTTLLYLIHKALFLGEKRPELGTDSYKFNVQASNA